MSMPKACEICAAMCRDEQVYRQKEQVAHERNVIVFVTLRKTAQRALLRLELQN